MNDILTKKLLDKYPMIFRDRNASPMESLMCFGFECSDGWYWLLDQLCHSIQWHVDHNMDKEVWYDARIGWPTPVQRFLGWVSGLFPAKSTWHRAISNFAYRTFFTVPRKRNAQCPVIATQVKEKFGGLRFYTQGGDERTEGFISLAEAMSYHICENCGSTEHVGQTKGWITTLCRTCANLSTRTSASWEEYKEEKSESVI